MTKRSWTVVSKWRNGRNREIQCCLRLEIYFMMMSQLVMMRCVDIKLYYLWPSLSFLLLIAMWYSLNSDSSGVSWWNSCPSSISFGSCFPLSAHLFPILFHPPPVSPFLWLNDVSDVLSFISSYYVIYVSIPSQSCFLHLLCNVYFTISSSDLFIP